MWGDQERCAFVEHLVWSVHLSFFRGETLAILGVPFVNEHALNWRYRSIHSLEIGVLAAYVGQVIALLKPGVFFLREV